MGKISGYAVDSTPNLGDKVIGTDVDNLDATKNFTIGQILSLGGTSGLLVPYTGATGPVNLGVHNITANSFIKLGGTSAQFLKADGSVDSNTYLTSAAAIASYVPYTGATGSVDLGVHTIRANSFVKQGGTSSQFLKADGSVDTNTYLTASSIQLTQVLNGFSAASQAPSALNTPLIISFGPAQTNAVISLDSGGKATFLEAGSYFINAYGNVERQGSSGGVSVLLFRALLNGTQISTVKGFHLDTPGLPTPYEVTIPFEANAGDVLWFEIMRDSSGTNAGGVYPHTNLGGWSNVPSTQLQIWKLN
jgi:hypothetical protein